MSTKPIWRQEIELLQTYSKHKSFTFTTDGASAENAITLAGNMEECNKISFIVETGDLYIGFDEDASTTTMLIPANEGYFDDSIYISVISFWISILCYLGYAKQTIDLIPKDSR